MDRTARGTLSGKDEAELGIELTEPDRTCLSADWWQAVTYDLCDLRTAPRTRTRTTPASYHDPQAMRELRPVLIEHHLFVPSEEQLAVA
ncbi:MAG: hypothetical protein M0R74_06605 [Dehalococcoidia bacterium]|nr:hypothetical protein [Dehalococcoidia bacterium]